MKLKILITLFICLFFAQSSCKKEPICACGIENPHENIGWLKTYLSNILSVDVYKVTFEETEYIIFSDSDIVFDGIEIVCNCTGEKVCEQGGENVGGHVCYLTNPKGFWDNYYNKRVLLFRVRDQKIIIDK